MEKPKLGKILQIWLRVFDIDTQVVVFQTYACRGISWKHYFHIYTSTGLPHEVA